MKWKKAPTKEIRATMDQNTKIIEELEKKGIKARAYWTMGRYDAVSIIEAPNEKEVAKIILTWQDAVDTETMVAISREEGTKLL
jgi:uncharacterized protein with GYD domain